MVAGVSQFTSCNHVMHVISASIKVELKFSKCMGTPTKPRQHAKQLAFMYHRSVN